jgi:hypothetical protein
MRGYCMRAYLTPSRAFWATLVSTVYPDEGEASLAPT